MMTIQTVGLRTAIWNNNLKSILLLLFYPVLILALAVAIAAVWTEDFNRGLFYVQQYSPWIVGAVALWFVIAYYAHQKMIHHATGAKAVTRQDAPRLYNMLENLCISRGMKMPKLYIIPSPMLNAYATGMNEKQFAIAVSEGLVAQLNDAELEAVLAHELTHIINRDVRLMVIAIIFVGIISFITESFWRMMRPSLFHAPRSIRYQSGRQQKRGGGILIAFLIALLGYLISLLLRFALSRRREFMADAGAVELTKNPNAMISALMKVSGQSDLPTTHDSVKELYLENRQRFLGLFATHPPIEERIKALQKFGGHLPPATNVSAAKGPWESRDL